MSSVPTSRPLPSEFAHPALQELLRLGATRGSVEAAAVRTACEEAQVPMPRMKAVLRALDDAGITIDVPAGPAAKRAVAATTSRSSASTAATEEKPARKPKPAAKPAAKAAATPAAGDDAPARPAAAKTAAKPKGAKTAEPAADGVVDADAVDLPEDAEDIAVDPEEIVDVEVDLDIEEVVAEPDVEVVEGAEVPEAAEVVDGAEVAEPAAAEVKEEEDAFVLSDDDDDAPAQQVATAGATADPVKDYLKQIGKVAAAQRRAGGRARQAHRGRPVRRGEARHAPAKLDPRLRARAASGSPRTAGGPRTTCSRPTCAWWSRWPSATPAAACSSWT